MMLPLKGITPVGKDSDVYFSELEKNLQIENSLSAQQKII